eukprot:2109889-Rhodomonas_salina.1
MDAERRKEEGGTNEGPRREQDRGTEERGNRRTEERGKRKEERRGPNEKGGGRKDDGERGKGAVSDLVRAVSSIAAGRFLHGLVLVEEDLVLFAEQVNLSSHRLHRAVRSVQLHFRRVHHL